MFFGMTGNALIERRIFGTPQAGIEPRRAVIAAFP
jgi:hypothetical protein